jgi:hypothetical protein
MITVKKIEMTVTFKRWLDIIFVILCRIITLMRRGHIYLIHSPEINKIFSSSNTEVKNVHLLFYSKRGRVGILLMV